MVACGGRRRWLSRVAAIGLWLASVQVGAQAPEAGPAPEPAAAAQPLAQSEAWNSATLRLLNRSIVEFRAPFLGAGPGERVMLARRRFADVMDRGGPAQVTTAAAPQGELVLLDGTYLFLVTPGDADALAGQSAPQLARSAAATLRTVVGETREARDLRRMSFALLKAAAASLIYALLVVLLFKLRRRVAAHMQSIAERQGARLRFFRVVLFDTNSLRTACGWLISGALSLLVALLSYEWLTYLLGCFPYTRALSESLRVFLWSLTTNLLSAGLAALPGLTVAIVIFLLAQLTVKASNTLFMRVQRGRLTLSWLDADTAKPTRRLVALAVWVFALVMAYPYLPGSETAAFKGISVLLGLMVSLGGSSMIGHAGSGLILMYIRAYRGGEYVNIAGYEGTVTELGTFATRIRTGLGEEIVLPNALVIGAAIKNYSRVVGGSGFVLDTTVTIGYDTPWRQVEAMLLEAAASTRDIAANPTPRVFQLALSDFYIEYRLVVHALPTEPLPRAALLTELHRNIQDVFNTHGVQIMSPHYVLDPKAAKLVQPSDWYAAPARPAEPTAPK